MKPALFSLGAVGAFACIASPALAQVVVRAPFVRVETGGPYGTYVRAPFVRFYSGPPPVYYGTPPVVVPGPTYGPQTFEPGVQITPPLATRPAQPAIPRPLPPGPQEPPVAEPPPPPTVQTPRTPDFVPPAPNKGDQVLSFDQFTKSFQPRQGSYEVTVLNPLTQQPSTVRFALPPGTPERVLAGQSYIEYRYPGRQFVRIEFDRDGPTVISR